MEEYKIVITSDTHKNHKTLDLPEGDILIHAGDISSKGDEFDIESFLIWLKKKSRKYTYGSVFIAGNHDRSFDPKYSKEFDSNAIEGEKPKWLKDMLLEYVNPSYGVRYLENTSTVIKNLKIWGSPVTPWFYGDYWAFNKNRGEEIKEVWDTIPNDSDVVIIHGPVYGTLDYIPDQKVNVGCEDLKKYIDGIKPKLFICGHIHESYGITKRGSTIYVNGSYCNASYLPINEPHLITITK